VSLAVFFAILGAAALHAGWNALVRRDGNRDAAAIAVAAGGTVVGLVLVPFVPAMAPAAIPFAIGSSSIHVVYYALVARAYRHGELSVVYPVMRGLAPLLVSVASVIFIESANAIVLIGVAVVAAGIVSLGAEGLRRGASGLAAAVGNAFVIAGYTLVDGLGARASGSPGAYTAWILVGGGIATVALRLALSNGAIAGALKARLGIGLAGGAMSFGAYAIVLWAMTFAPIGAVAAIRESSVLFATALGALLLHERFGPWRWVASLLVVTGLALVKIGGAV
jgi:drug/metabolite transporter (DMT)-like permease